MQAQVLRHYGTDAKFELDEVPKPTLKPGHLLVSSKGNESESCRFEDSSTGSTHRTRFSSDLAW